MKGLLEANERSQAEQAMPDLKTQTEKMQVGVDSFAAQFADNGAAVSLIPTRTFRSALEKIVPARSAK